MSIIDPSPTHVIRIWWFLTWRGALLGFLAGGAIGFILGFALAFANVPQQTAGQIFPIAGYLAGTAVFAWVVSMLLKKSFSDFRIVLKPLDETAANDT